MPADLGLSAAGLAISGVDALIRLGKRLGEVMSDVNAFEDVRVEHTY